VYVLKPDVAAGVAASSAGTSAGGGLAHADASRIADEINRLRMGVLQQVNFGRHHNRIASQVTSRRVTKMPFADTAVL
jgi:hypothetical protein